MGKKKKKSPGADSNIICKNRRAFHNYQIGERMEAGLVLQGTEVKSCRECRAHLNDAYVQVVGEEAFLVGAHISEYAQANRFNHEPVRTRKLLLHRKEIEKLATRINERGYTVVPLSLYFKNGYVKAEIALARGQSHEDRRERIKERDANREIERTMKRGRR